MVKFKDFNAVPEDQNAAADVSNIQCSFIMSAGHFCLRLRIVCGILRNNNNIHRCIGRRLLILKEKEYYK